MAGLEFHTPASTVRIHDDWVEPVTDSRISELSRIVSASYRRRAQAGPGGAAAAFRAAGKGREV